MAGINNKTDRYLKGIVDYCIKTITIVIIAVYIACWFDIDTGDILPLTCSVFGGELLLAVIIKIMGGRADSQTTSTKIKTIEATGKILKPPVND